MPRTRVFTRPVGADAESRPAIRIGFNTPQEQAIYFALLRIAGDEFGGISQTALARNILSDWVKAKGEGLKVPGPRVRQGSIFEYTGRKPNHGRKAK